MISPIRLIEKLFSQISKVMNLKRIAKYAGVPLINSYKVSCSFNGIKVQGKGRLIIGNNFHSGEDILVITQNHNYKRYLYYIFLYF